MRAHFILSKFLSAAFAFLAGCSANAYGADGDNFSKMLVGRPVNGCPLSFEGHLIRHYRIIYPSQFIESLASDSGILTQDVCECRLLGDSYSVCAKRLLLAKVVTIEVGSIQSSVIKVLILDRQEFETLFSALRASPVASGDGAKDPPPPPPPQGPRDGGPADPTRPIPFGKAEDGCELEQKICYKPKSKSETTAYASGREAEAKKESPVEVEFTAKCKGREFSFSTSGEATVKLGHFSVSFSSDEANGSKEDKK